MSGGSSFGYDWDDSVARALWPPKDSQIASVNLSENASNEEKAAALSVGGARWNAGKERWDLVPFDALAEVVRVYTRGAEKYSEDNWLKGMPWRICIGATFRHFTAWILGEDRDQETGCHHLAHAIWNLMALLTYGIRGMNEFDDRL